MSISVIHFSDIHIKGIDDVILHRIDKLKAACVSALPSNGDVVIAVSGDIAFSGKKEEYALAKSLFEPIINYIANQRKSKVYFVCVPGNHDCDFSTESSVRKALISSAGSAEIDATYYNSVSAVQKEYFNFAEQYDFDMSSALNYKVITTGNKQVLFLLANTAWMSNLKETPGRILMPTQLFPQIDSMDYAAVFYMFHHPENWLNPDYKKDFIDHIRKNADMILVGHEHARDSYQKIGNSFSVFCNHAKELQDSGSSESAFSVINFEDSFLSFSVVDFKWDGSKYNRTSENEHLFHKNASASQSVFHPNESTIRYVTDIGITVNHFAKDDVSLQDLFVWPDLTKTDFQAENKTSQRIRTNANEVLRENALNILIGSGCSGKSSIAKQLFYLEEPTESCCLLMNGCDFTSSEDTKIRNAVENGFIKQYNADCIEDFRQLPKEQRSIIIDDFDSIKNSKDRRIRVLDYLCSSFGRVTILMSSEIEITSILTADVVATLDSLYFYDICPLGNKKRKELIQRWYNLNNDSATEDEISSRVENAQSQINTFLGNGAAFLPAVPMVIISTLQNVDAVKKAYAGSKYSFLYESLIISSLSRISSSYTGSGEYNIDISILSRLAFEMLNNGNTSFTEEQLKNIITLISEEYIISIASDNFVKKMETARIIYKDPSAGEVYRFRYPYIFYYFCGRYIAYNLSENGVKEKVQYMSSRLYNETYGNIIIFVCHFANSSEVIDDVLLNAYYTLNDYPEFDFSKSNPIFDEIKDSVEALIPPTIASNDVAVADNKDKQLMHMDEVGINDGHVDNGEIIIDDEVSDKEKDMAAVVSALKTIEVLGQILQNYPIQIKGPVKIDIISEMQKLGMRSVQAIIGTLRYLEQDLVDYIYERACRSKKYLSREDVIIQTHRFINMIVTGMARSMIHEVAVSLKSEHLLSASTKALTVDPSISSKLVLMDLKLNCLNKVDYNEIYNLKKSFDGGNERFASRILDSIIGYFLNYNNCDHALRAKLCALCGFSEQKQLISTHANLLN